VGEIRDAASVILLRDAHQGFEVFLLRRHRSASFMASAYVFPGGAAETGEDARTTAARELFEEAGVLLARDAGKQAETLQVMNQETLRSKILGGQNAAALLELTGLAWSTDTLVPWSHWITPSIEAKRFSARFFVVELPYGQDPQFDETETVDQVWVTPQVGLAPCLRVSLPYVATAGPAGLVVDAVVTGRVRQEVAEDLVQRGLGTAPSGATAAGDRTLLRPILRHACVTSLSHEGSRT